VIEARGGNTINTADNTFQVRCKQLIRSLPIPRPFTTETFFAGVAEQHGKNIELIHAPLATGLPCGMLVSTDETDFIIHRTDATDLHAQHTDMHELGHLLLGHGQLHTSSPAARQADEAAGGISAQTAADTLHLLLPELSPRLIRRILGRTVYGTREEWEAETFASELMVEIHHPTRRGTYPIDLADHLAHLRTTGHREPAGQRWRP
jgi:hypothetical protein